MTDIQQKRREIIKLLALKLHIPGENTLINQRSQSQRQALLGILARVATQFYSGRLVYQNFGEYFDEKNTTFFEFDEPMSAFEYEWHFSRCIALQVR